MSQTTLCPACHRELPSGLPPSLCPVCVLGGDAPVPAPGLESSFFPEASGAERFGAYELLEEIARGGMGVVYKARQTSLGRVVALKRMLFGPQAKADIIQRFRMEASSAAALQHPNIVAVHEVGIHAGEHFIVMDFVEGKTLAALVREEPLPPKRAARYLRTMSDAIHHAHTRHILHRDLKPSNVLIDTEDKPRITDFGLAKQFGTDSHPATDFSELTYSGQFMGSPGYVSPEQAMGERGRIGPRSDVYSLGATLYHLLTGRPPFVGESLPDTINRVLHLDPVSLQLLNPAVPPDLETICLKCLEKEPERRYTSAEALAEELERFLGDMPIQARPAGRVERLRRWSRRNPRLAVSLAALAFTMVSGTSMSLWQAGRANKNADEAQKASVQAFLGESRAGRVSGLAGRRFNGLNAMEKAARISPSLAVRNEAIACLGLLDVRVNRKWDGFPSGGTALAFSPNVERYAVSDHRGAIRIDRSIEGRELMSLRSDESLWPAHKLLFSPAGRHLAALHGPESELRLWDLVDRNQLELSVTNVTGSAIDFSPDGKLLAVSGTNGMISIINLATRNAVTTLRAERTPARLLFDRTGRRLAVSSFESLYVRVFDLPRDAPQRELYHPNIVRGMAWHPHLDLLATACGDQRIHLWDLASTNESRTLSGHTSPPKELAFNHRGDLLASSSTDRTLIFWNHANGQALLRMDGANMLELRFSPDDLRLMGRVEGTEIQWLEVAAARAYRRLPESHVGRTQGRDLDLSPDGRFLAVAAEDGVHIYDLATESETGLLPAGAVDSLKFHPRSGDLLTSGYFGLHRFQFEVDRRLGPELLLVGPPILYQAPAGVGSLSVNGDGSLWAVSTGSRVQFFTPQHFAPEGELPTQPGLRRVVLSPDGHRAATAHAQAGTVQIWETGRGALLTNLNVQGTAQMVFSPDNRWLAIGTEKQCTLWQIDAWSYRLVGTRSDPNGRPGPLAFSPDGRVLAFAVSDRTISLVDCATGELLASLEAPERLDPIGLRFSSDGARIVCAAANGPPAVWELPIIRESLSRLGLDWGKSPAKPPPVMETANPARLVFDNGRMERAQQDLQLLQQLAESSPPSNVASNWAKRGWLNTQLGWHDAAVQDYTRALEMEVRADWYYSRGLSHAWLHQHSEAIADLERAMNLTPDYPEGCAELAFIRFYCPDPRYRDESAGRRLVDESFRLAPSNSITQLWMALAEHRAGHDAESIRILEGDKPGETGNLVRAWLLVQAMSRARAHDLRGARQSFELGRRMLVEEPTLRAFYFNNRIFYRAFLDEAAQAIAEEESRAQSTAANKP